MNSSLISQTSNSFSCLPCPFPHIEYPYASCRGKQNGNIILASILSTGALLSTRLCAPDTQTLYFSLSLDSLGALTYKAFSNCFSSCPVPFHSAYVDCLGRGVGKGHDLEDSWLRGSGVGNELERRETRVSVWRKWKQDAHKRWDKATAGEMGREGRSVMGRIWT